MKEKDLKLTEQTFHPGTIVEMFWEICVYFFEGYGSWVLFLFPIFLVFDNLVKKGKKTNIHD